MVHDYPIYGGSNGENDDGPNSSDKPIQQTNGACSRYAQLCPRKKKRFPPSPAFFCSGIAMQLAKDPAMTPDGLDRQNLYGLMRPCQHQLLHHFLPPEFRSLDYACDMGSIVAKAPSMSKPLADSCYFKGELRCLFALVFKHGWKFTQL